MHNAYLVCALLFFFSSTVSTRQSVVFFSIHKDSYASMHEIPLSLFALFTFFPHSVTFCFGHVTFRTIECYASDFESVKSDGGGGVGRQSCNGFLCLSVVYMYVYVRLFLRVLHYFLSVYIVCVSPCACFREHFTPTQKSRDARFQ